MRLVVGGRALGRLGRRADPPPPPTVQKPHELMPKLFGELRQRYLERPGGYTRVLRTEPKDTYSQAPSALLELVDGPRDMRFAMTAAAMARDWKLGRTHHPTTKLNMAKVTRYRKDGGEQQLNELAKKLSGLGLMSERSKTRLATEEVDEEV